MKRMMGGWRHDRTPGRADRRALAVVLLMLGFFASPARSAEPVLLVSNKHEDTLSFVDPATLRVLKKIPVGHNPHEMVVTPDGRFLYASNYDPPGETVSVVDLVHRRHVLQIPTGRYTRIHSAAMAPDGRHAYFTAGQTGFVVEIDTRTNTVRRGIPTHGKISHMVEVSPDGTRLYTANIESQDVSVIDRESGELLAQIPCGQGCEGLQFTPDGRRLWVANQEAGTITIIDVARNAVEDTIPCPGMPLRIRFTRDGTRALVSNWVAQGEVVVFDARGHKEVKRLRVGNQPIGLLIAPEGDRAFVSSMSSDEVHVIDMKTLTVSGHFVTGKGPDALLWWAPSRVAEKDGLVTSQPAPTIQLFNGKDLDGFYTYLRGLGRDTDPNKVFTVADGVIRISGEIWGCITTNDEYEDYELVAEFKWGERTWPPREKAARDSGILLHSVGADGGHAGVWMCSTEVQIIEGGTGDLLVVGDGSDRFRLSAMVDSSDAKRPYVFMPGGKAATLRGSGRIDWFGRDPAWKDVTGFRGTKDVERPHGEWNRLDCAVVGDTVTVMLNGVIVNRCFDVQPRRGRIQVQSEGAEILFRRLDLLPLGGPSREAATTRQATGE